MIARTGRSLDIVVKLTHAEVKPCGTLMLPLKSRVVC